MRKYSRIFWFLLAWCGLSIASAFAIDDTEISSRSALCRRYSGSLSDYAKSVQATYEAAIARNAKVIGRAFAIFDSPVEERKLLTDVTNYLVCVQLETQPASTPNDEFSIQTIPAQRVVSTSCKEVADGKACHGLIAEYLKKNKLGILGTYINGKDADGSPTMSVPVGPLPAS